MSVLWGPITVDLTFFAPTQSARFAATQRRGAQTVSFRTLSAAVLVSLMSHRKTHGKTFTGWADTLNMFFSLDINECVAYTTPCPHGQTCINTVGSYTCRRNTVTCGRGYHLTEDGTRCEGGCSQNELIFFLSPKLCFLLTVSHLLFPKLMRCNFSPLCHRCRWVSCRQCVWRPRLCQPDGLVPLWMQNWLHLQQYHQTVRRYSRNSVVLGQV